MATTATVPALTTVFTPPSSCLERTYTLAPTGSDSTDKPGGGILTAWRGFSSECFPSQATLSDGYVYLSPGLCPSAYSIASQWLDDGPATYAFCCPWYMHASDSYYDCGSFPETTTMEVVGYGQNISTAGYAWDTPIVVAWKSSDLSILEHHPTAVGTWNSAAGIPSPASATNTAIPRVTEGSHFINLTSSAPESETPTSAPASDTGLSTGAQAGIGVGISLGVILVLAIPAFLLWRRRKAKKLVPEPEVVAEADGRTLGHEAKELSPDMQVHEASGESKVHEMATGHDARHEMYADSDHTTAGAENPAAELEGSDPRRLPGRPNFRHHVARP